MNKLRQVELKSGKIGMTCWVDDLPELKEGAVITLQTYIEPERKWKVEKKFDTVRGLEEFGTPDSWCGYGQVGQWLSATK